MSSLAQTTMPKGSHVLALQGATLPQSPNQQLQWLPGGLFKKLPKLTTK
jgi:hypothetical protein